VDRASASRRAVPCLKIEWANADYDNRMNIVTGQRILLIQQIPVSVNRVWIHRIIGKVVEAKQSKTGAWFAHSKDHRLWLDRIVIRMDNGELSECILDQYSHIEILADSSDP